MSENVKTKKRLMSIILTCGCFLLMAAGIAMYYLMPCTFVSIDVNPSFEMQFNRLGNVVAINPSNADAKNLLDGLTKKHGKSDVIISELISLMTEQGYLGANMQNDILISVEEGTTAPKLLEELSLCVKDSLATHKLEGQIATQSIKLNPELEATAAENNVSAGKMAVIEKLASGDSSITPSDLAELRVSDLLQYAKDNKIDTDVLEEHLDALGDKFEDSPEIEALEEALDDADDDDDDDDDTDDEDDEDADKPTTDKPAVNKPTADKPAVNKPAVNKPTADKPTADKPTADKPTADKPAADKPTADKPAADSNDEADDNDDTDEDDDDDTPSDIYDDDNKPATDKPVANNPAAGTPAIDKPTTDKPAADSTFADNDADDDGNDGEDDD